ncbi:MAG: neutral/alkaline non-lysosomal ceramidase N-terminal domain-containing protein, partial [Myxococcaceae bacterium]
MSRCRRYLRALGPAFLLTFGGAYALSSWNWCGDWELTPPDVELTATARGELRAGAGRREVLAPWPVVPAGYGPLVEDVGAAERPLNARAVVLEAGDVRAGLVSLDALSTSDEVVQQVRASAGALGLSDVWIIATHSHSSLGGYDDRLLAELAGIGQYRDEVRDAFAGAAVDALRDAIADLQPVQLQSGAGELPALVRHRTGDAADARFTRVVLAGAAKPVAELWIWSAHPTLVARPIAALSPDYPGWIEAGDVPVVLLQGAVGNASAIVPEGEGSAPERYARALSDAARSVAVEPADASVFL